MTFYENVHLEMKKELIVNVWMHLRWRPRDVLPLLMCMLLFLMYDTWPNGSTLIHITLTKFTSNVLVIIKHANHVTITTSGQIMSRSDYLKTKTNVKIKLQDLCETLIIYILLSTF